MAGPPLYILLCSGEHEKIQMAAMMASVAAVSARPVEVFVSMDALAVFARDADNDARYRGGPVSRLIKEKGAPDALDLFRQGRELGELKLWACSAALDLRGWTVEGLAKGLFEGPLGLMKFLGDAAAGQLVAL